MATHSQIQYPPLKGEKPFQDLCLALVQHEWSDPYAQIYGRTGQPQQGVDISGTDNRGNFKTAGCQCKGAEGHEFRKFSETELSAEVELAKTYTPNLDLFIVAYMGRRDAKLQAKARELNDANQQAGLFKVVLWSWDDIVERAEHHSEVRKLLQIEEGYIAPLAALDPKRPPSELIQDMAARGAIIGGVEASILGDTSASGPRSPADAIAEGKIDVWRDQIRAGNGSAVVEPLRVFAESLNGDATAHVRFRAWANLGAALEQVGDRLLALDAFEKAVDAEPNTASGRAYKARILLAQGMGAAAYSEAGEALALDKEQRFAAVILVEAAPSDVSAEDLERRLGDVVVHVEVGTSLASRYSAEGRHDDALRIARETEAGDWPIYRHTAIAMAILQKLEGDIQVRMGIADSADDKRLLQEARALLEEAWGWGKARADKANWYHVAANLVTAYRFTGDDASADDLAIETLGLAPDNWALIERAVVALIHKHQLPEALELAGKHASQELPKSALLAADVAALAGDWAKLKAWAEETLGTASTDDERSRASEHIVLALYRLTDAGEALEKGHDLRAAFPPDVGFEARMAEVARRSGDDTEITGARRRLDAFDAATLSIFERFELANAYADDAQWERAARLLEGLYRLDTPSEPLSHRLFYLFRADARTEARALFVSLTGDALKSKRILRLGAAIYERSGMLPDALKALDAALREEPADLETRMDWARLSLRAGKEKQVSKWVRTAATDLKGGADAELDFAFLLDRFGRRTDALAVAYRTLRAHWGQAERLHLQYMSLFLLRSGRETALYPKAAGADTVVFLQNEHGERRKYRIEADAAPYSDVLSPDMPFAKLLIGQPNGAVVSLPQGIGQPDTWTIFEIKHKYIDLLHEAFESHETVFPGSSAFGRFHIDASSEGGLEPIFEQARGRSQLVDNAVKIYRENVIPVDSIAKVLGTDAIDASRGLRFISGVVFDACVGTDAERAVAVEQMSGVKSALLEPVTLALWQEIGLLPELASVGDFEVQVVQASMDLLGLRVENAKQDAKQKGGTLEARGDKISFFEPTKDERQARVANCEELLAWCRQHAKVVPSEPLRDVDGVEELLSDASMTTLGTLIATGTAAIIEDRRLRSFAGSLGAEKLAWTQALLMAWVNEGRISHTLYVRLISRLQRAKVGFTSVGHSDLIASIAAGDSDDFDTLASALDLSTVDRASLVGVIASFAAALWIEPAYKVDRDRFISKLLNALLVRADGILLLRQVFRAVRDQLIPLPFPMRLIVKLWFEYEKRFVEGHFIRHLVYVSKAKA